MAAVRQVTHDTEAGAIEEPARGRIQMTISASGSPSSLAVATSPPRSISITVNSVPQGATLTVDGKAALVYFRISGD